MKRLPGGQPGKRREGWSKATGDLWLTGKDMETWQLIARGFSNQRISDRLCVQRKSVENRVNRLGKILDSCIDNPKSEVNLRVLLCRLYPVIAPIFEHYAEEQGRCWLRLQDQLTEAFEEIATGWED